MSNSTYDLLKIHHEADSRVKSLYDIANAVTIIVGLLVISSIIAIAAYFIAGINTIGIVITTGVFMWVNHFVNTRYKKQLKYSKESLEACLTSFPDVYIHASTESPKVLKDTKFSCIVNGVRTQLTFVYRQGKGDMSTSYWIDALGNFMESSTVYYESKISHWFNLLEDETYVDLTYLQNEEPNV